MFKKKYIYNAAAYSDNNGCVSISEEVDDVEDREVNFVISRDDDGCDIAYNQCIPVYSSVTAVVSSINTGLMVKSRDPETFEKDIRYLERKRQEHEIDRHLNVCLTNRENYGVGAIGKKLNGMSIDYLTDINTKTSAEYGSFRVTTNPFTGRPGVIGVDPDEPKKEVVAVQVGRTVVYNQRGEPITGESQKHIYFTKDDIMILGNYQLGRIRGQSSVKRVLRYVEALLQLQNTMLLLSKRPNQLVYTAGNEKHNLLNCELPQSYIESAKGDRVKARIAYKNDMLTALNTEAKKLADGNVLAQIIEYGTDIKSIEIPEGLPYIEYIKWFENQITKGITTIDTSGSRVVRSRQQEANFRAELVNKSKVERELVKIWLNNNLTKQLLYGRKATIDDVWFDFKPAILDDKLQQSVIWMQNTQAVRNLAQANMSIPNKLKEFMEIEETWDKEKVVEPKEKNA